MKKNVIVTRIDQKGIPLAKALFSCLHFQAGWKDDLLLLAHEIPQHQLQWFRERDILVKQCKPLYRVGQWSEYSASKLYIFTEEMKLWDRVVCLDSDIIVRASLDSLKKIDGFAAVPEMDEQPLVSQLSLTDKSQWKIFNEVENDLHQKFNLHDPAFNGGVIVFSTDILKKNTFLELEQLLKRTKNISRYADQTVLNLYFYKQWKRLPRVYNLHPFLYAYRYHIPFQKIDGINLHFSGINFHDKPCFKENPFYNEWKANFELGNFIDRNNIPTPKKVWSKMKIWWYEQYLRCVRGISLLR